LKIFDPHDLCGLKNDFVSDGLAIGPFPLTPALSLEEREKAFDPHMD
jgi:hypothetical protein